MAAKSNNSTNKPQRAGLPLARANRLNEQIKPLAKRPSGGVLGISTVAVIGLVAVGTLAPGGVPTAEAKEYISVVGDVIPLPAWLAVTDDPALDQTAQAAKMAEPAGQSFGAANEPVTGEKVASLDASVAVPDMAKPQPVISANPDAPYCIRMIETHLGALGSSSSEDTPWTDLRSDLGRLVQNALDCPDAGVQIVGSLALASTDIADMRLRWDRSEQVLELATVARNESAGSATSVNPQVLELVFR